MIPFNPSQPSTIPGYIPKAPTHAPSPTWAERTGLDHGPKGANIHDAVSHTCPDIEGRDIVANGETQH